MKNTKINDVVGSEYTKRLNFKYIKLEKKKLSNKIKNMKNLKGVMNNNVRQNIGVYFYHFIYL